MTLTARIRTAGGDGPAWTQRIDSAICEPLRISLDPPEVVCHNGLMAHPQSAGTDAGMVAGRIGDHDPHRLTEAIERWCVWLDSLGRRSTTISAYRRTINAWALAGRHEWCHDLTYEHTTAWMAWKRSEGHWSGKSYNYALAAFCSLTAYLTRLEWLQRDPLIDADRSKTEDAPGARSATTTEARALIAQAVMRQADGRSKGNRALYWACLFLTGARYSEPAKWLWSDLLLNDDPPMLLWRPEIQKIPRRIELVLAPELAGLLRAHRDLFADASEMVFAFKATRPAFRDDMARAGIVRYDARDRGFSPHSARKWFATTLQTEGVPTRLVDRLMRHAGRVEDKYFDPPIDAQVAALSQLPRLWPSIDPKKSEIGVDTGSEIPKIMVTTAMKNTTAQLETPRPGTRMVVVDNAARSGGSALSHSTESGDRPELDTVIGVSRPINGADPIALAGLLNAQADQLRHVARLLQGVTGHERRSED